MGRRKRDGDQGPGRTRPPAPPDDSGTAFPAPQGTPGQAESRSAYERFQALVREVAEPPKDGKLDWEQDYLALRAEGWDWRKAAYIAWASSPVTKRWPATQRDLAIQVLGLHSDQTIRKWREANPAIDDRVGRLQAEPMFRHRRDVIDALIASATLPKAANNQDRRLFFELTGDLKQGPLAVANATASANGNQVDVTGLTDAELEAIAAGRAPGAGGNRAAETPPGA